jgi:hypothetical protein
MLAARAATKAEPAAAKVGTSARCIKLRFGLVQNLIAKRS